MKNCSKETFLELLRKTRRDKFFKKYKKSGLEADIDHYESAKMALQKVIAQKMKYFFKKKLKRILIIVRNYGKILSR